MMKTQMMIRIEPELKSKIRKLAKSEGKSVSVVVRELLVEYAKTRDIESYIDQLWDRIGGELKAEGVRQKDIEKTIVAARRGK